jgi:hypothetical protein
MGHEVGGSPFSDDLCEVPSRLNTSSDRECELRAAVVALRRFVDHASADAYLHTGPRAFDGSAKGSHRRPASGALRSSLSVEAVNDHDLT